MKKSILAASIALLLAPAAHAELFISEYVEGSANNKALEFFNPTDTTLNLADYRINVFFNGAASAGVSVALDGELAPGATYVFASASASAELLSLADQTIGGGLWNGDDAITLTKDGQVIDSIGQVGFDPGTAWGGAISPRQTIPYAALP